MYTLYSIYNLQHPHTFTHTRPSGIPHPSFILQCVIYSTISHMLNIYIYIYIYINKKLISFLLNYAY